MTTPNEDGTKKVLLATVSPRNGPCQQSLSTHGLLSVAVLRDPAQLPDLWRRGANRPATRCQRPQTNGFVERLHRTILDEHFRIEGRKTWYESIEVMQQDLGTYLGQYNHKRPHQSRNMDGMTPIQVFKKGLKNSRLPRTRRTNPKPHKPTLK